MGSNISKEYASLPFAYVNTNSQQPRQNTHQDSPTTVNNPTTTTTPPPPQLQQENIQSRVSNNIQDDDDDYGLDSNSIYSQHLTTTTNKSNSNNNKRNSLESPELLELDSFSQISFQQLSSSQVIGLCSQNLVRLSRNIGLLQNISTLQLCCNDLTEIPPEIGHLKNLTHLSLEKNRISYIPDTIGLLSKLVELKLNSNNLSSLPSSIGLLSKLSTLRLERNILTSLPHEIGLCSALVCVYVSYNPLEAVPAELGRLKFLRTLNVDGCPMLTDHENDDRHSPPSLKELCARAIIRNQIPLLSTTSPALRIYLSSSTRCSFSPCSGPYFEAYIRRIRFVERNDETVAFEYRLCSCHWTTESEMRMATFCSTPITAPSPISSAPSSPPQTPRLARRHTTRDEVQQQNASSENVNSNNNNNNNSNSTMSRWSVGQRTSSGYFGKGGNYGTSNTAYNIENSNVIEVEVPLGDILRSPSLPMLSRDPRASATTSSEVGDEENNNGGVSTETLGRRTRKNSNILKRSSVMSVFRRSRSMSFAV